MRAIIFFSIMCISSIVLAWGAPDILPAEQRSKSYEFETKVDKKKGFQKIVIWAAKTFVDSNETVKLKDTDLGVFIAKGNISCEALKLGNGWGKNQRIEFTLEVTVEDKKAEVKVSDVVGRGQGYDDGARPSKKEEMDAAVKDCIDPFVERIRQAVDL